MTASRKGGSTLNVGSYIMSFGGLSPSGQPVQSVDMFDPRRASLGWQPVPQWRFPRATRDQCTVVTRDPQLGSQVMVMGGHGEEHSVMKLVLGQNNWYSVPPMSFPRVQVNTSTPSWPCFLLLPIYYPLLLLMLLLLLLLLLYSCPLPSTAAPPSPSTGGLVWSSPEEWTRTTSTRPAWSSLT